MYINKLINCVDRCSLPQTGHCFQDGSSPHFRYSQQNSHLELASLPPPCEPGWFEPGLLKWPIATHSLSSASVVKLYGAVPRTWSTSTLRLLSIMITMFKPWNLVHPSLVLRSSFVIHLPACPSLWVVLLHLETASSSCLKSPCFSKHLRSFSP